MKTLKEFDYDLWATEDGAVKRYWIRVKATGEVSEVSKEVMTLLWNEEKRMRREIKASINRGVSDLSYDALPVDDVDPIWLQDPTSMEENILNEFQLEELRSSLTPAQLSVFEECIVGGKSHTAYAKEFGVSIPLVTKRLDFIRKKAKFTFTEG